MAIRPPNYTQTPNEHLDNIWQYSGTEFKLLSALDRLTFGYHRKSVRRSISKLCKMTGLSRQSLLDAAKRLESPQGDRPVQIAREQDGGVTIWSVLIEEVAEEGEEARTAKPAKAAKPHELDPSLYGMAALLAEVTLSDLAANNKRLFSEAKLLKKSGYDTSHLLEAFGREQQPDGLRQGKWYRFDWRGREDSPPTVAQVRSEIRRVLALEAPPTRNEPGLQAPPRRAQVVQRDDGPGFYA